MMKKINQFFRTTLIGGISAILPLFVVVIILKWLVNLIESYLGFIVRMFNVDSQLEIIALYVLSVILILILFFFIGLMVRTQIGNMIRDKMEKKYLMKIPGYKTLKEIVMQFMGLGKSFFTETVLIDVFNCGTLMTGFITDEEDESGLVTVFTPTGPNPTTGFVYHVPKERIIRTTVSVNVAIKSIISCGAGSSEVFAGIEKAKKMSTDKSRKKNDVNSDAS